MPRITIDRDRCKGCELCTSVCPQQILSMSEELNAKGYFFARMAEPAKCIGCRLCAVICPDIAVSVEAGAAKYCFFEY